MNVTGLILPYVNFIAFLIPEKVVIECDLRDDNDECVPLNIGIVRNGNYFGFYMEIPSYEKFTELYSRTGNLNIRLSMSEINSPPGTRPGTHLIAISSADCSQRETDEIDLSSSFILNYYRQFFLKLRNVKTSFNINFLNET